MKHKIEDVQGKYEKILKLREAGFKWREIAEAIGLTVRQAEGVWGHYRKEANKKELVVTGTVCIGCKGLFKQESKFNRMCLRCKKKPGNDWLAAS